MLFCLQNKGSVIMPPALQSQPEIITLEQYETLPEEKGAKSLMTLSMILPALHRFIKECS